MSLDLTLKYSIQGISARSNNLKRTKPSSMIHVLAIGKLGL